MNFKHLVLVSIMMVTICGCSMFKKKSDEIPQNVYVTKPDPLTLKSTDKTYQISDTPAILVLDDGKEKEIAFNGDWYIIHKDWIKEFNENQNLLISILEQKKSLKTTTRVYKNKQTNSIPKLPANTK